MTTTSTLELLNARLTMARALGYDYAVKQVVKTVDGDTVDLVLSLGFRLSMEDRFRVLDINTPERYEARFAEATGFTRDWLAAHLGSGLRVTTLKNLGGVDQTDKYGRWLAYIYDSISGADLSSDLLAYESAWKGKY